MKDFWMQEICWKSILMDRWDKILSAFQELGVSKCSLVIMYQVLLCAQNSLLLCRICTHGLS